MANWRQIQGRIRRARTSADPVSKLDELFQKTRDAMVAFEAGALEEKSGRSDEAVRWYTIAAERFRRADWRQKAAEALTRLGAAIPEPTAPAGAESHSHREAEKPTRGAAQTSGESRAELQEDIESQPPLSFIENPALVSPAMRGSESAKKVGRRRGRRGGRRHRRGAAANPASAASQTHARGRFPPSDAATAPSLHEAEKPPSQEEARDAEIGETSAAQFVSEPSGPFVERATYIRAGDPALASRFAHLESLLRRLISAPLHRVDETEEAPAGPGVFLLSDSDLMTNYYVEACRTLRIGTSQLARSGRAGRGARAEGKASLRNQLAEHLEISETKVNDYLKKHCAVRWLQLDEDATRLAHFAIALLRPALNTD